MTQHQMTTLDQKKTQVTFPIELSLGNDHLTLGKYRFHYSWLRDYCLCEACRHLGSSQRLFDISDRDQPPKPLSVDKEADKITIQWEEKTPYKSVFSIPCLLSRANNFNLPTSFTPKQLWCKKEQNKI